MQEIDFIIDDQPDKAPELVKLAIRNKQAHQELQSFNDTKQFQYVHRLTIDARYQETQYEELRKLKRENPEGFLSEITNLNQNIRRIESQIRKKKYKDETEHQSWEDNLRRAKIKRQIIIGLM